MPIIPKAQPKSPIFNSTNPSIKITKAEGRRQKAEGRRQEAEGRICNRDLGSPLRKLFALKSAVLDPIVLIKETN
jgi:hypothetical protein